MNVLHVCLTLDGHCYVNQSDRQELNPVMKGPWTDLIPKLLQSAEEDLVEMTWTFVKLEGDRTVALETKTLNQMKHFWLAIVRNEDLIQRTCEVCKEQAKIPSLDRRVPLDSAIERLRTGLKMRGRQA